MEESTPHNVSSSNGMNGNMNMHDVPGIGNGHNGNGNNNNDHPTHRPPSRQISQIDQAKVKTGIFGASSNLVNSIVGAGIIGIPYAINQSGFIIGVILLIIVSYFTDKSLRMIVELASFHPKLKDLGVLTFEDLMRIPYGQLGANFILASMFILAYGAMVAYLLIIKDSVPTVLGLGDSFAERELVMLITSLCIMVPLSMMRDISQLAFTSFLSVAADLVLVIIVMLNSPIKSTMDANGGFGQVLADNWINSRVFIGLGVLSTAMACQHSAFLVSGTLENRTAERWATVTGRSLFIAWLLSSLLGIFGYLGHLDETEGDILNNFDRGSTAINASRALLAITMVFTYPMESFVARHVLSQLFYNGNLDNTSVNSNGEIIPEIKFMGLMGRREQLTFVLYVATLIPALIFSDLGPVLSLTGSLGASAIAYIAPGLVYLGINGAEFLEWASGSLKMPSNTDETHKNGEVELPVVGDANASMQTTQSHERLAQGTKPWWWFPIGMPFWVAIAAAGEYGTKQFIENLGIDYDAHHINNDNSSQVIGPNHKDFYICIIFIIFGIVAAVCGVLSNIYVEINEIFFTPR